MDNQNHWPHPGSRWWKFDFHTHTPASLDTRAWQGAMGTPNEITPEKWLLKHMAAGMDCVAVTDHNSGAWVDKLKQANEALAQQAAAGDALEGYRPLTVFPGVELSVNGGFHLLALFDPEARTSDIDSLLGAVGYKETKGDSDGVTGCSGEEVIEAVLSAGAIPIPAHADQDKGLLQTKPESRESVIDSNTLRQVVETSGLLAVEKVHPATLYPERVDVLVRELTTVVGSDCHSFQGNGVPGSRFTWIKMETPTLEGLRLALLDGNGISVRRSDEGPFEPFNTPDHFITQISIANARLIGNGEPELLSLTPFYNALIGGRGTGKSSVVHALRLAYRRREELGSLGDTSEPFRQFKSFEQPARGRDGKGALRDNTKILIELFRNGVQHRLIWERNDQVVVVEEMDDGGVWHESSSQSITPERFPIRLFSQGQIAAMAGENSQALLSVIDEAAEINDLTRLLEDHRNTFRTQRARIRELDGRLSGRDELERKLSDVSRALDTFAQSDHAHVMAEHQKSVRQRKEVEKSQARFHEMPARIEALAQDLLLDDWPEGVFDRETDQDALAWRAATERVLQDAAHSLRQTAKTLTTESSRIAEEDGLRSWQARADRALSDYDGLQRTLADQGVEDPSAFGRLVQQQEQLNSQLQKLTQLATDRDSLEAESTTQFQRVVEARAAITRKRREFLRQTLADNTFVKIDVVEFGSDAERIGQELRTLLNCENTSYESDIFKNDGSVKQGLAQDMAVSEDRAETLQATKARLLEVHTTFGGHFRNHLTKQLKEPEFADRINCWFPSDDLSIEYSRSGNADDWRPITEGSQGQRSAALLAFLLTFGSEPIVLDQPEDDLDNQLIYDLIVRQIRSNKQRRQLIIVTHNPNVVVNGDAEMVHVLDFRSGQCTIVEKGSMQTNAVRARVCEVMEGGEEALSRRWARLGQRA